MCLSFTGTFHSAIIRRKRKVRGQKRRTLQGDDGERKEKGKGKENRTLMMSRNIMARVLDSLDLKSGAYIAARSALSTARVWRES